MFYSQFILAKKGPLGTIWIAAHLERKLRKNQVADTDIGVSVDSILFPDAPIALRLSSHLLLGVVRIYSKKVNYLFNDCSEALIKIKHAFRSTAVDLPPEESTAPYNSITLPENFDLDNFELPDSACLDSNFVDHHVSTREQITLQETVNDSAYQTTKFGLDERFGDEDASLELDEELFIDKRISPQHDEVSTNLKVSGLHQSETSVPLGMDAHFGYDEEKGSEIPNELSELLSNNFDKNCFSNTEEFKRDANSSHRHGYTIQTPDLNEVFQPECHTNLSQHISFIPDEVRTPYLVEHAQEPSTPGLLEVVPGLSPHQKAETHVESCRPGSCSSPYMEIKSAEAVNENVLLSAVLGHKTGETTQEFPLTSVFTGPVPESLAPTYSNWNLTADDACVVSGPENQQSGLIGNEVSNISTADRSFDSEKVINSLSFSHQAVNLSSPPNLATHFEEPVTSNICINNMDALGGNSDVKRTQKRDSNESSKVANLGRVEDGDSCVTTSVGGSDFILRSCGLNLHTNLLHSVPSLFSHETIGLRSPPKLVARFETDPVTSNVYADNMDGGISDVKKTQKRDFNELSQITNIGHVEDGDSCISSSMVGSDFLSRSCGSNLHPIFFHADPTGFSHETINLTTPSLKLEAHCEAEPATSNICTDSMDVFGGMTQKRYSNEPSHFVNPCRVEDGDSCISTSVVGSDFISRSRGSNLDPIFLHDDPSGFSHDTVKMTSPSNLGDPSAFSYEAVNLTSTPNQAGRLEAEPVTSNICTDNTVVAGGISNVKRTLRKDNNEPSQIANLRRAEDGDSCISTSVVGSDFLSRSCGSNLHLSSSLLVDGALGEASELSLRDHSCRLKTPMREEALHNSRPSFEVQGEDLRYTNDRVINLEDQHMSRCIPSDFNYGSSKLDELSMGVSSKVIHSSHAMFPPNLEFLGPEKMLAPNFVDLPNFQVLQAADKEVTESDGSVDRNSTHFSRKRSEMDSNTILQTGSFAKLSGIPRSRRSADYIHADHDVLASILAGKTAPSLETGSIPFLSRLPSQKRPRTMPRVGMHKRRKVLMDDAMVLHADAIRQQLINTEDIRRMRKKAPCSRPEIWKIYMGAMEDDIFDHCILTGKAVELNNLYDLKYEMQNDHSSQSKEYNSQVKASGEARVSDILNEMGDIEIDERFSYFSCIAGRSGGPSSMTEFDTVQTAEGGAQCDLHDHLEDLPVQPQVGPNDPVAVTDSNLIIQGNPIPEINKVIPSFEKHADRAERSLFDGEHDSLNTCALSARDECATLSGLDCDTAVAVISESLTKAEIAYNAVGSTVNEEEKTDHVMDEKHSKSSHTWLPEVDDESGAVVGKQDHVHLDSETELLSEKTNELDVVVDPHHAAEALVDGERHIAEATCAEVDNVACAPSSLEYASSTMDKNSCKQDFKLEGCLDADSVPVDIDVDARDSSDFCSAIDDNYTGFLNEDDDDADFDETENDVPNPEDAQSVENSGWSARTRGVARYLKNLFDEESGQGRKSIVVNRLLAGKTRKEASRMFFETLVLKTRDYIQVEQENPFEHIHIKPRIKLLKSEF